VDFENLSLRMDVHRSRWMPGRVPWSQFIVHINVTPNVTLVLNAEATSP
jgi:hypothetical protein